MVVKQKQSIPAWSVVLAIVLVLALVVGFFMFSNPGAVDKDTLIRLRTKPGSAPGATPGQQYGMPRGTPITHEATPVGGMSRQKPGS